jgi:RecA/RadA recombinase
MDSLNGTNLSELLEAIQSSSVLCGATRIVTIDGPAGSGKTTLANKLATEFAKKVGEISVIHLDELYDGWDGALDAKLFERIEAWILTPIRNGLSPKHLKYDWHLSKFTTWNELPLTSVLIIEGVGAGHTMLRPEVSQAVWIEADEDLLLDRVVQRDGEEVRDEMLLWKTRERDYFELHNVKQSAHFHFVGQ